MVAINEIFDIRYGNQFDFSKMELSNEETAINFISRGSSNNGLVGRVKKYQEVEPFKAGLITVTMGGSYLLASFVQPAPFYTAQNVKVLSPKSPMTIQELLFYCAAIQHNRFRYHSHSREANSTFDNLIVPSIDEIPLWVGEQAIISNYEAEVVNEISADRWKWFNLTPQLFDFKRGKRLTKADSIDGEVYLVTAGEENQGVRRSIDNKMDVYSDCITIDMFGYCVYRGYKFCCDDNILVLIPRKKLSKYVLMFVVTVINQDRYRYAYGRQYRQKTLLKHKIKLPVDSSGNPDWEFMENYIKSLPYSANI